MEVWQKDKEVGIGDLVRVELASGNTHFQTPEALDIRYPQAIREFCEQEGIRLPGSFQEYERVAAQAALVWVAEEHQTLDILATREALRSMPDSGGYGYRYTEGYDPHSGCYICEQSTYIGQDRYADTLRIYLDDGTAYVERTWGSSWYWDRFVYPLEGEPYYAGMLDEYRVPPSWVVKKTFEVT